MNFDHKLENLFELEHILTRENAQFEKVAKRAEQNNPWFTQENIDHAMRSILEMIKKENLTEWTQGYDFSNVIPKQVGLILAGNIPLVGFHDIICGYLSGHKMLIKSSSKDEILTEFLVNYLNKYTDSPSITLSENLRAFDAIIATGSNQSSKQFERYFKKYPRIIRKNRNGVAILEGNESEEDIIELGKDIFTYFGLGCRNVSKIYIPSGFNIQRMIEIFHDHYKTLIYHNKYKNNYDYNYALYLLNKENFLASGSLIMRKHKDIVSRIACLHYEEYDDVNSLKNEIVKRKDEIQCIVSSMKIEGISTFKYGESQQPGLWNYADGIDTLEFLIAL